MVRIMKEFLFIHTLKNIFLVVTYSDIKMDIYIKMYALTIKYHLRSLHRPKPNNEFFELCTLL